MTRETPQTMPWLNQLVRICRLVPEAKSSSPSLEVMLGAQKRSLRPALINAQTIAIGVRDKVLPPMPTEAPSETSAAASSSDMTFSRRLRSRSLVRRQSSAYPSVTTFSKARTRVELGDQAVPGRGYLPQPPPKALA